MYKNYTTIGCSHKTYLSKFLLVMRITAIIIFTVVMQVSAGSFAQKITLTEKRTPLIQVFEKIRVQSGFDFLITKGMLKNTIPVTITVRNADLKDVLQQLFKNQPLEYEIKNTAVVVSRKTPSFLEKVMNSFNAIDIQGKIIDENDKPLVGATILVKGASVSAISGADGKFSLNNLPNNAILVISYIGYITKEISLSENLENIHLIPANSGLNEVVVVGYGTQKKINVTGSVAQVKGSELAKSPVADLSNSLIGRLPGLRATQNSGEPGYDGSSIDIRGFGGALVIVDGVPSSFSQIDANEIETFSILKDASAAVYGVRAANGVILVTTKKGSLQRASIGYNAYYGLQNNATKFPELANSALYAELSNEAAVNAWVKLKDPTATLSLPFSKETLQKYKNGALPSYNWYDATIRENAPMHYQNINVDGGNQDVKYFFNLGYLNQDGMWRSNSTQYTRYNFRSRISANINKHLTADLNLSGYLDNRQTPGPSAGKIMNNIKRESPVSPIYANGNTDYLAPSNTNSNSLAQTDKDITGYNSDRTRYFSGIFSLTYLVPWVDGLSAKASYSYQNKDENNKNYQKKYYLYVYNEKTKSYDQSNTVNDPTRLDITDYHNDDQLFQGSLHYEKTFSDKHHVSGLLLLERSEGKSSSLNAYREFLLDNLDELFGGVSQNQSNKGSSGEEARQGLVGKFNYDYLGKYLFEFGFRNDGTYKFAPGKRYGFFPNFSAGWKINEENFMKNLSAVDNLKLRVSWGKVGDDGNINPFQYLTGYNYPNGNYLFGSQLIPGLTPSGLTNPVLTWFTSFTSNAGLDVTLWKGLLAASIDIFYRKRTGLLTTRVLSLPNTFGAGLPQENLNGDNTRGFEIELTHQHKIGSLSYSISPNVSFTRSKSGYIEQSPFTSSLNNYLRNNMGRWQNIGFGYVATGQFQSQQEINTAAVQDAQGNTSLLPGDIRYQDLNGDGIIDGRDQTVIGRGETPEIFYGLNLNVRYKGFDLSVLLQGADNFNRYYDRDLQNPFYNGANTLARFEDRWHRADLFDPNSQWIPGKFPSTITSGTVNNGLYSTFWLQNAAYMRIKNINLGYTLPKQLLQKVDIKNARIYVSASNLFTFSGNKFIDPEAPTGNGDFYPQQKLWTMGLNVSF